MRVGWTGVIGIGLAVGVVGCPPGPPPGPSTRPVSSSAPSDARPTEYAAWARFDPGATAAYVVTYAVEADGSKPFPHTLTRSLRRLSAQAATVVETVTETLGRPEPTLHQYASGGKTGGPTWSRSGTADVAVAGHTYHCVTYTAHGTRLLPSDGDAPAADATAWISDEVPGGIVRLHLAEVARPGDGSVTVSDQTLTGVTGRPAAAGRALPATVPTPVTTASLWVAFRPGSTATYDLGQQGKTITFTLLASSASAGAMLYLNVKAPGQPDALSEVVLRAVDPAQPDWSAAGSEDVAVDGRMHHCTVYTGRLAGADFGRMWVDDQVPGGLVKVRGTGPDGSAASMTLTTYQAR